MHILHNSFWRDGIIGAGLWLSCVADNHHVLMVQMAAALQAEKLILMTDVPGVLKDKDDIATKYTALDIKSTRQLVADGIIAGGMIPK
jgi:acetylglutamate kinase